MSSAAYLAAYSNSGPSRLAPGDVKAHDDDQNSLLSSPRSLATRRSFDSEIEPLLLEQNHHTAPPAYEYSQYEHFHQQPARLSYGTTPSAPFFEERIPQSLASRPVDTAAEVTENASEGHSRQSQTKRNRRSTHFARLLKLLAIVLIVFAISSILWKVLHKSSDSNTGKHEDGHNEKPIPSGLPATPSHTQTISFPVTLEPIQTKSPKVSPPTGIGKPTPGSPGDAVPKFPVEHVDPWPACSQAIYPWVWTFDSFEKQDIMVIQEIAQTSLAFISGDIQLVAAPTDQKSLYHVAVTVGSNEPSLLQYLKLRMIDTTLTIDFQTTPDMEIYQPEGNKLLSTLLGAVWKLLGITFPDTVSKPCIVVRAIVSVRPEAELNYLDIRSRHLTVILGSGLSLDVKNQTTISTTSSSVKVSEGVSFTSRKTIIDVSSGSIQGDFALLDLLSLHTLSGSIHANVYPGEADRDYPAPAELRAVAISGSVDIKYPLYQLLPDRDYIVSVTSGSGSIAGDFVHGHQTILDARSGSISGRVLPYATERYPSTLQTSCQSGRTQIEVLAPLDVSSRRILRMTSVHNSASGSVSVRYPRAWEGDITEEARSGSASLVGEDIMELEHRKHGSGEYIRARKGHDGNSMLTVESRSGSVSVLFRDL